MARFGLSVAALMVLLVGAVGARAQDTAEADRMVRVFQHYCIDTAADPGRAPPKAPGLQVDWDEPHFASDTIVATDNGVFETTVWPERADPHHRLVLKGTTENGIPSVCQVIASWVEPSHIVRALQQSVSLGEQNSTSAVERDDQIIRWTTHVRDVRAVAELRVPTYIGKPGRKLTLRLER